MSEKLDLIVVVAQHKDEDKVVDAALGAGAPGITYFYGQGTGVRQKLGFLGRFIESEKVVLLMCCPHAKSRGVLDAVKGAIELEKPGQGFACVVPVSEALGAVEDSSED
ncbi:P-II family nitrogen regulator [Elusimicrobiota bacterium]